MSALETVDLDGVEILATGGPVHGRGSPAGGDVWTTARLRDLATANQELVGELRPPARVGHVASDAPAVGWLENLRVNAAGDKLLADIKRVPRKFAELVKARAYRTRSVELSRVTSQRTGRRYDMAVTGLAWLGGKMPAVRTLDDVVALYADEGVELRRVYSLDEPIVAAPAVLVDQAIATGALPAGERAAALRRFEIDAELAAIDLESRQPNKLQQARNYWALDGRDELYLQEAPARLGIEEQPRRALKGSDRSYAADASQRLGIPIDELV